MPTPSRTPAGRPRGRQVQAEANDARVLRAARAAFAEFGWDAPVSVIAKRAGVGMGSLYRRYPTKDDLARHVQVDGLDRWTALVEGAAERLGPWDALVSALRAALTQGGEVSMLPVIGGRFASSPEVDAASARLEHALGALVRRAVDEGFLRPDVTLADLVLLLQLLGSRLPGSPDRVDELRARYLDLTLAALRAPAAGPLAGPAPQWPELLSFWNVREDADTDAAGPDQP
ncbi:TetR/AcrR family transcriptional regulator [Streptomyces sp. NBC_01022]|uniref:TetR/AcrR family transcriptional regulator n=1 Tax=Streptomyces sp. NBC_01022 TaxID=2903723 RepID=UPI002DD9B248|nr:TetR/AcrR family transcriptional regulator [Streptomyces sp. NBC_01022]WRZ84091.1 TetR/AcrR family transcriptional regulator [Streptomyces sp. NBC_01022]